MISLSRSSSPGTTWKRDVEPSSNLSPACNIMDRTLRVLLVEDAPFLRYAFARLLRLEGFEVKEVNEDKYFRKERSFGSFYRAFTLPSTINPDSIKATFKDGVLEIEIPKPEEQKPKQVQIKIE